MTNPVETIVPANVWTKVATAVTSGQLHKLSSAPRAYYQTYRMTGDSAPTEQPKVGIFESSQHESAGSVSPIDVYVYALGLDGLVRVDV